jgi:hypothetical protein
MARSLFTSNSDTTMKKIYFVVAIFVIVILCDMLVGAVSKNLIMNVPDVGVNQTNAAQALFRRKADILILGASRANHSYNCKQIEDSLGLSAYNAGRDGQNMVYAAMVFYAYLERYTPKIVILDVSSSQVSGEWNSHLNEMNCFYGMSKPVDEIIDHISSFADRLKLRSNLYRYNNTWQWLLQAHLAKSQADLDGYRPMPVNENTNFKSVIENGKFVADTLNVGYLNKIVKTCKERNVKLILSYTPSLMIDKGNFQPWLKNFAKTHCLMLMDYADDSRFTNHPELFYDMTHLNSNGADLFTKDFLEKIFKK